MEKENVITHTYDLLRYLVRLAKDLHCLDLRRYEYVQEKINNIGAQVGAWIKSLP